ncbi:hypothetical protein BGZ63DRAFT_397006 [Mariannaea sp. PMI_226]|nr:hypothetical protein BGZ63DRAFT_397006 [Mariannaea sp. PMI_226]
MFKWNATTRGGKLKVAVGSSSWVKHGLLTSIFSPFLPVLPVLDQCIYVRGCAYISSRLLPTCCPRSGLT